MTENAEEFFGKVKGVEKAISDRMEKRCTAEEALGPETGS
jgi:hypothetical protein